MTINANSLNTRINSDSVCNLTELELLQVVAAAATLEASRLYSVAAVSNLPSAANNIGRFIFVQSIQDYRYSDGTSWIRNYNSSVISVANSPIAWSWGYNLTGQLGDNTIVNKSSPVLVVGGFCNWRQVSAGGGHTAAVRIDGTAWAWGNNSYGQLGDGTAVAKSSPVSVVGGFIDWCQVSAGKYHTAAVRTTGSLWAWGGGRFGRLGNNSIFDCNSPVSVVGGFSDWCQVSAGYGHTAAVRTTGSLWAWGANRFGQLGNNYAGDVNCAGAYKSSPVSVIGGFSDWCQVSSTGRIHTAAVRTNGTLWTWGRNAQGQLGDGTSTDRSSPVSVVGGFTNWCQVSAGKYYTAAVRTTGSLWSWGSNLSGQLGDGTVTYKSSPVSVVGGFTNWCQVSGGNSHAAAVRIDGTAWAWGSNASGQLGDGTLVTKSSPVSVVGGFAPWGQVSAGNGHTIGTVTPGKGFLTP